MATLYPEVDRTQKAIATCGAATHAAKAMM